MIVALLVAMGSLEAFPQTAGKTRKPVQAVLKYPGSFERGKSVGSRSGTPHHKRVNRPVMKTQSGKELWGYLIFDLNYGGEEEFRMGMGTFTLSQADEFTLRLTSELDVAAGACADEIMYLQDHSLDAPVSFSSLDLLTGEEKKIKEYEENTDPCLRDLSFDYTTRTMYGIGCVAGAELFSLYTVDLDNGACTELFPLEFQYWTLAVDSEGAMYGVTTEGDLCRIDVETQSEERIGPTNEFPWYIQSMDFDRSDGTLYWAGYTEDGDSFLATIDVTTGQATRIGTPLGDFAEIVALHVPAKSQVPGAPAAVSGLEVTAGEQGALTVGLSWTNPSETIAQEALGALTRIDIYRNEERVHTFENPVVNAAEQWTDAVPESGFVVYKLIASNEEGEGRAAKSGQLYVGRDIPGEVGNLVLTREESTYRTSLSWTAPVTSMNGGWFDASEVNYDVIRYPDHKIIGENLKTTDCTDRTITSLNAYSYEIVPKTPDGEGVGRQSDKLFVGPPADLPYFCDFSTQEARDLWIIEDANQDGCTWQISNNWGGNRFWFMDYNILNYGDIVPDTQADEWFFSAPFNLEKGPTYTLQFKVRLGGTLAQEKFRTVLCRYASHEAKVKVIGDYTTLNDQNFQPVAATFDVPETGVYHLGFQCYSDPDQWLIHITDISLERSFAKDMKATRLKGLPTPIQNEPNFYEVTVVNNGTENVSSYRVEVIDREMNIVGVSRVERELAPQQNLLVQIKCVLPQSGTKQLRGRVILDGDEDTSNDLSPEFEVESLPAGTLSWHYAGNAKSVDYSPNYPFVMDMPFSRAQTLYLPADLQFTSGKIEKLAYYYYLSPGFGIAASEVSVRVSLANTEVASLLDSYIAGDQFTKVFEGTVSIDPLNNILVLNFDTPFEYAGKNLCILTERSEQGGDRFQGNNFLYTEDYEAIGEGRTRYYFSESVPFGPEVESMTSIRMPNVSLLVDGKTDAIEATREKVSMRVYPNPAADRLWLEGDYSEAELITANGIPVRSAHGENSIGLTGLDKGVYFLKIRMEEGVQVYKILLE